MNAFMDEVHKLKLPVPPWDVNRLNKAASAFTTMGRDKAIKYMLSLKLEDYGDPLEVSAGVGVILGLRSYHCAALFSLLRDRCDFLCWLLCHQIQ